MKVTVGGDRLGSGKKMKVDFHNYQRSTHDLSYVWRSTMAAGTLVPFMSQLALPGDTFDIELNADVLTHPTIGPLFGTYKVQLDVFQVPFRLYVAELHMNKLGIGRDMSNVFLPQVFLKASAPTPNKPIDNQQINSSCIFSYLGMRGLGTLASNINGNVERAFNAIPYLAYWDIYKNYYANKQEEVGVVIHKLVPSVATFTDADITNAFPDITVPTTLADPLVYEYSELTDSSIITLTGTGIDETFKPEHIIFKVRRRDDQSELTLKGTEVFTTWNATPSTGKVVGSTPTNFARYEIVEWAYVYHEAYYNLPQFDQEPTLYQFPLKNIDDMRSYILQFVAGTPFKISNSSVEPYSLPMQLTDASNYAQAHPQEGLAIKTYQSDLFNNWISTEWIDGTDGIAEITAIDTSGGSFTIDELNLSQKVYDMLNRIAISGGSYDDWLDAVYTHERQRSAENPMYLGGLIKQIVFQEVVATAQNDTTPLGTLAGRGVLGGKHKGGKVIAKVDEPSYILGIVSITPNVDYSQGNSWDTNLRTMNDLHKPALDQIGFQDLITDQLAWWDTKVGDPQAGTIPPTVTYKSAGKQPAWTNYMTNVNKCYGNFADQTQQMWMTLNRRYSLEYDVTDGASIKDLTTYIDPSLFNHIFADTRRDAQNFWTQISCQITARRKMSAKVMPNL